MLSLRRGVWSCSPVYPAVSQTQCGVSQLQRPIGGRFRGEKIKYLFLRHRMEIKMKYGESRKRTACVSGDRASLEGRHLWALLCVGGLSVFIFVDDRCFSSWIACRRVSSLTELFVWQSGKQTDWFQLSLLTENRFQPFMKLFGFPLLTVANCVWTIAGFVFN